MLTLIHVEREYAKSGKKEEDASIGWIPGGKAFVIRNKANLCSTWMPMFFGQAKFSSFTRKLYRWGFRKINMAPQSVAGSSASSLYFGNENFQRDNTDLLTRMRSVTAAKTRSEQAAEVARQSSAGSLLANPQNHHAQMLQAAPQGKQPANLNLAQQQQQALASIALQAIQLPAIAAGVTTIDQATLIQQATNLAALQRQLAAQQFGVQVANVQAAPTIQAPQVQAVFKPSPVAQAEAPRIQIAQAAPAAQGPEEATSQFLNGLRQLSIPSQVSVTNLDPQQRLQLPFATTSTLTGAQQQVAAQVLPQIQQPPNQPQQLQFPQQQQQLGAQPPPGAPIQPVQFPQQQQLWAQPPPGAPVQPVTEPGAQAIVQQALRALFTQSGIPTNPEDQEQLRGVIDLLLRYGPAAAQQQQQQQLGLIDMLLRFGPAAQQQQQQALPQQQDQQQDPQQPPQQP